MLHPSPKRTSRGTTRTKGALWDSPRTNGKCCPQEESTPAEAQAGEQLWRNSPPWDPGRQLCALAARTTSCLMYKQRCSLWTVRRDHFLFLMRQHSWDYIKILHPVLSPQMQERDWQIGVSSAVAPKMGLVSLKQTASGAINSNTYGEVSKKVESGRAWRETRGRRHKSKQEGFRVGRRKNIFPMRTVRQWKRLPRKAVQPGTGGFQDPAG